MEWHLTLKKTISGLYLGDDDNLKEGSKVKRTGRIVEVPVGEKLIGS